MVSTTNNNSLVGGVNSFPVQVVVYKSGESWVMMSVPNDVLRQMAYHSTNPCLKIVSSANEAMKALDFFLSAESNATSSLKERSIELVDSSPLFTSFNFEGKLLSNTQKTSGEKNQIPITIPVAFENNSPPRVWYGISKADFQKMIGPDRYCLQVVSSDKLDDGQTYSYMVATLVQSPLVQSSLPLKLIVANVIKLSIAKVSGFLKSIVEKISNLFNSFRSALSKMMCASFNSICNHKKKYAALTASSLLIPACLLIAL